MDSVRINNLEFARSGRQLKGEVALKQMPRLVDFIKASEADLDCLVAYELQGSKDTHALPSIQLDIVVKLPLICQRCLDVMHHSINISYDYMISDDVPEDADDTDDIDWLEASIDMDVIELVEDEVLLAIPFSPKHKEVCVDADVFEEKEESPFAVLKGKIK